MTCVVGLIKDNTVYMGADSCAGGDTSVINVSNPKIFLLDEYLIGVSGSFRVIDILNYSFKIPSEKNLSGDAFMRTTFINALRTTFEKNNFPTEGKDDEFNILVGHNGRLYIIQDDFSVLNIISYGAIGSGADIAYGSLFTSTSMDDPLLRIEMALNASATFSPDVSAPFIVKSLPQTIENRLIAKANEADKVSSGLSLGQMSIEERHHVLFG